jgi:hypothetical protein
MPYDSTRLTPVLAEMKRVFVDDHNVAVRGQNFIKLLHAYCIEELKSRGLNLKGMELKGEIKVLTSHKFKDVDVSIVHPTSGPLLIIGVRSQMSSLSKNFLNYYEMEIGDVAAIHERYPLCVVGLLYLHPTTSILPGKEKETFDFARAEKMFSLIAGRERASDSHTHYEEIAYLRVDFAKNPPEVDQAFPVSPGIRIDDFFDKLYEKFVDRNFPLFRDTPPEGPENPEI